MRIIDKINATDGNFVSFEYFPPKTEEGKANLLARIQRMAKLGPLYIDVTWATGPEQTLEISKLVQTGLGIDVMMHVACSELTKVTAKAFLDRAKAAGIGNILAIRGDVDDTKGPAATVDFPHTIDFIKFVRKTYGNSFGIAVAGFPEGYPSSSEPNSDMKHLVEKVEAGADLIVTQLFYDANVCINYIRQCRSLGIKCPIVPGIMPIQSYRTLVRMSSYCHVKLPEGLKKVLEPIKDDDAAVKKYGVEFGTNMIKALLASGLVKGVHFYTLNLARSVSKMCSATGLCQSKRSRPLPWAHCSSSKRKEEGVRPIFWANRPQSYVSRTSSWDEFPNGRWGDARSPAFGDDVGSHLFGRRLSPDSRKVAWGERPIDLTDIISVFARYIEGKIDAIPWCEGKLHSETNTITTTLRGLMAKGCLTINSQPRANGCSSEHPIYGWGGKGGVVYQKAYVEFFASPETLNALMTEVDKSHPSLIYHAIDVHGNSYTNNKGGASAVTWGVWPNTEIKQPTVVDPSAFVVWKEEAFKLWLDKWGSLYDEDSDSYALIHNIYNTFFLVNIVDHDFVKGDIFSVFECLPTVEVRAEEKAEEKGKADA